MEIGENLDTINDANTVLEYAQGYAALADYGLLKASAIGLRLKGLVSNAMQLERDLDAMYQALPAWARTW